MTLSELARVAMLPDHTHGRATPLKITTEQGFEGATGEFERAQSDVIPVTVLVALYRPGECEPYAILPVTAHAIHPYVPASGYGPTYVPAQAPEFVLRCDHPDDRPKPPEPKAEPLPEKRYGWKAEEPEYVTNPVVLPGGEWTAPPVPTSTELET